MEEEGEEAIVDDEEEKDLEKTVECLFGIAPNEPKADS